MIKAPRRRGRSQSVLRLDHRVDLGGRGEARKICETSCENVLVGDVNSVSDINA